MKVRKNHLHGDVLAREVIGLTMTLSTLSLCGSTKEIPNPIKFVCIQLEGCDTTPTFLLDSPPEGQYPRRKTPVVQGEALCIRESSFGYTGM